MRYLVSRLLVTAIVAFMAPIAGAAQEEDGQGPCDICRDYWGEPMGVHAFCGGGYMDGKFAHCESTSGLCNSHPACEYDEDAVDFEQLLAAAQAGDASLILAAFVRYTGTRVAINGARRALQFYCGPNVIGHVPVDERVVELLRSAAAQRAVALSS